TPPPAGAAGTDLPADVRACRRPPAPRGCANRGTTRALLVSRHTAEPAKRISVIWIGLLFLRRESPMARAYNVVDADGHILEALDLWDNYIDPEFRERRPRFVIDENGKERLSVEGKLLGNPRGIGSLGAVGVRQGTVKLDSLKYAEGMKGGFDPHARIPDMAADGIDAAFLSPSL